MSLTFTKNASCLTLFLNGVMHTVPADSPNFKNVWNAIKAGDEVEVDKALNVLETIQQGFVDVVGTGVEVTGEGVFFNGKLMHNCLTTRIMDFMKEGVPMDPIILLLKNFTENPIIKLASNPEVLAMMGKSPAQAQEIVDELTDDFFAFLDHRNLPLTPDGCFLAYKTADSNYWSKRGGSLKLLKGKVNDRGQVYNAPGEEIECERQDVDPSRWAECSYGLHVGCLEYSGPGGWYNGCTDKVVIVKVNPKDVVAVPPDHNRTKMRVCAYTVVQDFVSALDRPAYKDGEDVYAQHSEFVDEDFLDTLDSVEDIYEGDEISFSYFKDGESKTRYLDVTEVNRNDDGFVIRIVGVLLSPEENKGQYRSFRANQIDDIRILS